MTTEPAAPPTRMRPLMIAIVAVAAALVAVLVIVIVVVVRSSAGGAAAPESSTSPSASSSSDPHESATPAASSAPTALPAPAAFVMPTCTQLALPTVPPRVATGELIEITRDDDQEGLAGLLPGPVAAAAALASPQVRSCVWGPPNSDGGVHVSVAEMTQEQWDVFAGQLAGGGWTAVDIDGAAGFMQATGEEGLNGPIEWWYAYTSGGWITFLWSSSPEVRSAAIAGLRAANP